MDYNDFTIRPSGKNMQKDIMGLYKRLGPNRWTEIFTGSYEDCRRERDRLIKERS